MTVHNWTVFEAQRYSCMHTSAIKVNTSLRSFHGNGEEQIRWKNYRLRKAFRKFKRRQRSEVIFFLNVCVLRAIRSHPQSINSVAKYLKQASKVGNIKYFDLTKITRAEKGRPKRNQVSVVFSNSKCHQSNYHLLREAGLDVIHLITVFSSYFYIPCGSIITSKKEGFYLPWSRSQWDKNVISKEVRAFDQKEDRTHDFSQPKQIILA